jgi:hypothetical protein
MFCVQLNKIHNNPKIKDILHVPDLCGDNLMFQLRSYTTYHKTEISAFSVPLHVGNLQYRVCATLIMSLPSCDSSDRRLLKHH